MKKVLLGIAIIAGIASCKSGKENLDATKELLPVNPVSYSGSVLTDTAKLTKQNEEPETEVITYRKRAKRKIIYYDEPVAVVTPVPVQTSNTAPTQTAPVESTGTNTETSNTGSTGGDENGGTTGTTETQPKKKGWSNAAKGAVIGGVGGAVAGAVINGKNRGKGAIIGGVIGAAGGYILGKKKDKNVSELYDNK